MFKQPKNLIGAALGVLVILVVLISLITKQLTKPQVAPQPTPITPAPLPTSTPLEIKAKVKAISQNYQPLTQYQYEAFQKLAKSVTTTYYKTTDFEIGYSQDLNKFFVRKITAQADQKIKEYFNNTNLVSLYEADDKVHGILFSITSDPVDKAIKDAEARVRQARYDNLSQNASVSPNVKGAFTSVQALTTDPAEDPEAAQDKANVDSFIKLFSQPMINLGDPNADPNDKNPSGSTTAASSNGALTAYQFDFSTDTALPGNAELNNLLNEVATKIGVSAKLIKGVINAECSTALKISSADVTASYDSSFHLPFCYNSCAALGPMQVTVGIDADGVGNCPKCGGSCSNASISLGQTLLASYAYDHTPDPFNYRDNVYMGAVYYKNYLGSKLPSEYTEADIKHAITCYFDGPNSSYCKNNTDNPRLATVYYAKVINYFFNK
jgi:hypothetical protein